MICSPELDRLGEDDLLLGGEQRDLADLLEVHPDRVVDPDHVRGERLELLRGRLVDLGRAQLRGRVHARRHLDPLDRLLLDDLDREARRRRLGVLGRQVEVLVVVVFVVSASGSAAPARPRRPRAGRMVASFASSSSRLAPRGRGRGRPRRAACQGIGHRGTSEVGAVGAERVSVRRRRGGGGGVRRGAGGLIRWPPPGGRGGGSGRDAGRATAAAR